MNNLKTYIIEKLSLNTEKIADESLKKFMDALEIKKSDEYVLKLKHYFDTDCDKYLEKNDYIPEKKWNSSEFEALLMLAVMLLADKHKAKDILTIGFKSYKGKNNPYDYSWFEGDYGEDSVLELIQQAYDEDADFKKLWEDFFKTVEGVYKNTKMDPYETIWFFNNEYYDD